MDMENNPPIEEGYPEPPVKVTIEPATDPPEVL
jgi:hypothetical protein